MVRSVHYCPATKKTFERRYTDLTSYDAFPSSNVYPTEVCFSLMHNKLDYYECGFITSNNFHSGFNLVFSIILMFVIFELEVIFILGDVYSLRLPFTFVHYLFLPFIVFQDENKNPLETEYGLSTYRDHQTFSIQVSFCLLLFKIRLLMLLFLAKNSSLCFLLSSDYRTYTVYRDDFVVQRKIKSVTVGFIYLVEIHFS